MIGKRSELRVVRVHHSESKAIWEKAQRRFLLEGESRSRSRRLEFVRNLVIKVPLASLRPFTCCLKVPGRAIYVQRFP